jgi:hypothetical protein
VNHSTLLFSSGLRRLCRSLSGTDDRDKGVEYRASLPSGFPFVQISSRRITP